MPDTKNQNTPSIWKWENTAPITKMGIEVVVAAAAVTIAATTIYATAKGVALSSTFLAYLANPWAIAIIAFVAAAYLIATAVSSCQQLRSMGGVQGKAGKDGKDGKDADFSALVGDAVKDAKIVEKEVTENKESVKKLYLELSDDNRKVLLGEKGEKDLYVIFKNKEGEYTSIQLNYKVEDKGVVVTNDFVELKETLGRTKEATSLKVTVSNKSHEALKSDVSAKLQEVAVDAAIFGALRK
ncbi:hypothetical protein [Wolbachia endosymbiont of Mansonella perstans]|uniref:hypothetical protein n=1 Tax=Wolbachia endosymbiont of Mansonella perstans TaxID=229526 RepID=UPI001CE08831|nr:hypothetical protein [Wolbachia endosymbiont of Mansonella perstans]MCA4773901.1 hypothetical protein [Wolbachia endosymbiont of Mansonella perstans]